MIIIVAESDRAVVNSLIRAWERIRREDKRVPETVLDLTPGRGSSCSSVGWLDNPPILQINLRSCDRNLTGREVLAWLIHQAAHAITGPSTSAEGRYHNRDYRDAAEELGLDAVIPSGQSTGSGWSHTSLAKGTLSRYRHEIDALDRALRNWKPTAQIKATRDSRNLHPAACSCSPPRRIRVSERNLALGDIVCAVCGKPFTAA
jgi:hypothetical protein